LLVNCENELLDALTIIDGKADFSVRIPNVTEKLKLYLAATNDAMEVTIDQTKVDFNLPNLSALMLNRTDADNDLLIDQFDADPTNPDVSSVIPIRGSGQLKSAMNLGYSSDTYIIFEDLWPSKGDYDFNDLVAKTTLYWVRGKSNYITEISGDCKIENIGADVEIGLGYELLQANCEKLTYCENIITEINGKAVKDEAVTNGLIIFRKVQEIGKTEVKFTMKIKEKSLRDFAFVPYLFRSENYTQQIRPFGAPPTKSINMSLLKTKDDASPANWQWSSGSDFVYPLTGTSAFYRTKDNHPWGIEFIAKTFKSSPDKISIKDVYPRFREWAESGGKSARDWYNDPF
jgi:LruC domain-containing protein